MREARPCDLNESQLRLYEKLYQDLGAKMTALLEDKEVVEILRNPDGSLWAESLSSGRECVGFMESEQAFSIIRSAAGLHDVVVCAGQPQLEVRLPHYKALQGQRLTGVVPPVVSSPSFAIRARSEKVLTLNDYLKTGRLNARQKTCLETLIEARKNLLIAGGPGSGKTTFANALIQEAVEVHPQDRFILLEDTPELQCSAASQAALLTTEHMNMQRLVRLSMRLSPSRMIVGEVRGAEVLDMLKAWNTGCPGGICTVHANGCQEAVQRLLDLSLEAGLLYPPLSLVSHTVEAVIFIERAGRQHGCVSDIQGIKGYENGKCVFQTLG